MKSDSKSLLFNYRVKYLNIKFNNHCLLIIRFIVDKFSFILKENVLLFPEYKVLKNRTLNFVLTTRI